MTKHFFFFIGILSILSQHQACTKAQDYSSSPNIVFDALWNEVNDRYCYFKDKQINWDSVKQHYQPIFARHMTEQELFDSLWQVLAILKDGHVALSSGFRIKNYNFYLEKDPNYNANIVARKYLGINAYQNSSFAYNAYQNVVYVRYSSFMNFYNGVEMSFMMDYIKSKNPRGVILDIRNNTGGAISYAFDLASYWTKDQTKVLAYMKTKEGKDHDNFSDFKDFRTLTPNAKAYNGKVVLITNKMVYSAANLFTAIMKQFSNVTVMGDTTGGGGGLPFTRDLPNGWSFNLSSTPLFDAQKHTLEFGVTPHRLVFMKKEDEYNNIDTIIEEAIRYLNP